MEAKGADILYFSAHKTLAEVDNDFLNDKLFEKALGEDGLKQLGTLIQASIESSEHNYTVQPAPELWSPVEWVKSDRPSGSQRPRRPAAKPAMEK